MPVLSLPWKLLLIYYRLHVDVYLAVVSVPPLTLFQRKTKTSSDHQPCGHVVVTWRLQIIFLKWPLKSRYTSECLNMWATPASIHGGKFTRWVPLPRCPVPHHSQNERSRKEHKNAGLQLREARGQPALHTLNQRYDRSPWGQNQLASSWKDAAGDPPAIAQGTGQPLGRCLQPVPMAPELGSSVWACVHPWLRSGLKTDISRGKRVSPWGLHFHVEIVTGKIFP